jgi:hypothetical protein
LLRLGWRPLAFTIRKSSTVITAAWPSQAVLTRSTVQEPWKLLLCTKSVGRHHGSNAQAFPVSHATDLRVDWLAMRRRSRHNYLELPPASVPSVAIGALALAAFAVGALAIGALAIGRLRILRADADRLHLGAVEIDDLIVKRLRVIETAGDEDQRGEV